LLLQEADKKVLTALGYKKKFRRGDDGKKVYYIVSLYSGRHYSMDDTEHILCKIWLTVIHAHQSRNLSKAKAQHNNHTWPLPTVYPWEHHLSPLMVLIWDTFKIVRKDHPYPEQVKFYFMDSPAAAKKKKDKDDKTNDGGDKEPETEMEKEMETEEEAAGDSEKSKSTKKNKKRKNPRDNNSGSRSSKKKKQAPSIHK
jgi:hypothetical protein